MSGVASPLRGFVRLTAYLAWTFACIPVQAVLLLLKSPLRSTFPMAYHRTCMAIIGIDVELRGKRCRDHPVLFAVNHSSYLDITLLGALMPVSFVAKAEVASWPLYGLLAKLQRTVFVERNSRKVNEQRAEMVARMEHGNDLVLFPEGTSSDGNGVLPFKSALLSAAEIEIRGKPVVVQPISIAYTHLDGIPLGRHFRPFYTWFGDMGDGLAYLADDRAGQASRGDRVPSAADGRRCRLAQGPRATLLECRGLRRVQRHRRPAAKPRACDGGVRYRAGSL